MWTMTDCVTAAAASLGPYDGVQCSGVWPTAWLLLLLHWGRMTALCCPDYGRLRDCCWCFIGAVWLRYVVRTMADCVTAAAASLGPYDCVMLSGLWPTAWLLLLLHWGRMTALCCPDYGRLRDCCCCLIGAVWRRSVFGTMGDCVTAAAASSGPYDCDMLFGLWPTAWLLLLLHWGRMTALCCLDYGRLRDCCCCFIGAVWLRYVVWTMDDCVTAAAASLGPYDCVVLSGLWATAWLLLLLHWGRMTAFCVRDYGRLRDCCCCFIGAVWLRYVVWTMADCVTAAAASLGPYDCVVLSGLSMGDCVPSAAASLGPYDGVPCSGLWPTAWLLLLLHWGRMTVFCVRDYGRLRDCCCCFIGTVWLYSVFGTMGDCVTAAAASLGPYDCDMLAWLWATAVRDCCCCLWCVGNARQDRPPLWGWCCWHRHRGRSAPKLVANRGAHCVTAVAVTVGTAWRSCVVRESWKHREGRCYCVSDAAACLGQPVCSLLSGLRDWCCCCTRVGSGRVSWWLLLLTHCCCSSVPHVAAALCSRIWWNFRVRRFGVDLSWRIDLAVMIVARFNVHLAGCNAA